jgi:hypothetical protein
VFVTEGTEGVVLPKKGKREEEEGGGGMRERERGRGGGGDNESVKMEVPEECKGPEKK